VLRGADRLAMLRALGGPTAEPVEAVPQWATLSTPLQECYAGSRHA
jgi:hypothetical protein